MSEAGSPHTPHLWTLAALVGAGGVLGTLVRAGLETALPPAAGAFPWTTFTINVVGAFLLGLLQEVLARRGPDEGVRRALRLGVGTGVIGGFTTYSTFVLETDRLLLGDAAAPWVGLTYVVVSLVAGLAAAVAGILAGRRLGGPRQVGDHRRGRRPEALEGGAR